MEVRVVTWEDILKTLIRHDCKMNERGEFEISQNLFSFMDAGDEFIVNSEVTFRDKYERENKLLEILDEEEIGLKLTVF